MQKIYFEKYSGAGNDFIIIDYSQNPNINLTPQVITGLCTRRLSIGADGILFIKRTKENFDLTYFNSDGTTGSLCGNGARCAIMFAWKKKYFEGNKTGFASSGQAYFAEVLSDENVKFYFLEPTGLNPNLSIVLGDCRIIGSFIDTGSPHFVIDIDSNKNCSELQKDFDSIDVKAIGREIRNNSEIFENGTNVNFVKLVGGILKIRTYERGVENETLACGTGSVASALIWTLSHETNNNVKLETRSGRILKVEFIQKGNKFSNISLTGPAEKIYEGIYEI